MKENKTKNFALLTAGLLLAGLVQGQVSVNASGGNATGSGGTVAYSIGQAVYTTSTGSNGSVAQGVQHAYEIYSVGIKETEMSISLIAFPNPTTDNLTLELSDYNDYQWSYQLLDLQGKLLNNGRIEGQRTEINMNVWPAAIYFLNIIDKDNKKLQSFKIIKQ